MIERIGVDPASPLPIAPAVRAGDYIFLSGQAAIGPNGTIINADIVDQTELTMKRIIDVLKQCDCTLADVVKATVWLDDARDFGAFNKVYSKYFLDHPPARSTVVSPLVVDGKVEIEVQVYKPLPRE
jgi:2-iminobutanoate/2-iminopropanoate deaminase